MYAPQMERAVEKGSLLKPLAFSGKAEDALHWLNNFTQYAKAQQWDDRQTIRSLATFMSDRVVAPWFTTLKEADLNCSWEEFSKRFIDQFVPPGEDTKLITQIANIKWTHPETINQYNTRFLNLINRASTLLRAPCMDDKSLLRYYLKGLPYLAHVHIGDEHATYTDAMRKAAEWSRVMYVRAATGTPAEQANAFNMMTMGMATPSATLNAMPTQPQPARFNNAQANVSTNMSTNYAIDPANGMYANLTECYNCGEKNHYSRNCPNRTCLMCLQMGHVQANCPYVLQLRTFIQTNGINAAQQALRHHPYARTNHPISGANPAHMGYQGNNRQQFRPNVPYAQRAQQLDQPRRMFSMVSTEPTVAQTNVAIEALQEIATSFSEANADTERIPGTLLPADTFNTIMSAVNSLVAMNPNIIEDELLPPPTQIPDEGNRMGASGA